jgi:hypothetical protein
MDVGLVTGDGAMSRSERLVTARCLTDRRLPRRCPCVIRAQASPHVFQWTRRVPLVIARPWSHMWCWGSSSSSGDSTSQEPSFSSSGIQDLISILPPVRCLSRLAPEFSLLSSHPHAPSLVLRRGLSCRAGRRSTQLPIALVHVLAIDVVCARSECAAVLSPGVLLFEAVQLDLLVDFAHQAHFDGIMGCLMVRVR